MPVVLLGDAGSPGNVVVQLPFAVCHIHNQECDQKHPLIPALQVPENVLCLHGVGGNVRGDNIHIESFPDSPLLGIDLHAVNVSDLPLDGLDSLRLVHTADVDAQKQIPP